MLTILGIAIAIMIMTVVLGYGRYRTTMDTADDAYRYEATHLVNLDFLSGE
jgi:hypothetical protein